MSKQNFAMRRVMIKPCELNVQCYAACVIFINGYLAVFTEANTTDKIGEI